MRWRTTSAGSCPLRCSVCTRCPARTCAWASCAGRKRWTSSVAAPDRVRVAAHAKLNLFLRILAREQSGYHQIETAFALLDLADELTVSRAPAGVTLAVQGATADLGPPEENLAVRAAHAVLEASGRRCGVAIELVKRIPARAGLGGGSSDAAAALVAVPPMEIATPDAYGWWDALYPEPAARGPVVLDAEALAGWGSIGRLGGNDFEMPVFGKHPALRTLYERLAGTKPLWVRLCGSGSAVAAVYRSERDREDAAMMLGEKQQRLIRTMTRATPAAGPEPIDS